MQKNELDLLREIKSLYKKLTEEPKGQYKGKVYIEPSAYIYSENAKKFFHYFCMFIPIKKRLSFHGQPLEVCHLLAANIGIFLESDTIKHQR